MILINEHRHGYAICAAMGSVFTPQSEVVLSRVDYLRPNGTVIEVLYGGVIYEKFTGCSVVMHTAGLRRHWMNRELLFFAFDYPFRKLDCIKTLVTVASTNAKALALTTHLGFTIEAVIENAVPGGDMLILSMERKDCRWLEPPRDLHRPVLGRAIDFGQAERTSPTGLQ